MKHLAIAIFYCLAVVLALPIMIPALLLALTLVYLGHIGEWLDEHIDFPWLNGPYRAFIDSRAALVKACEAHRAKTLPDGVKRILIPKPATTDPLCA